MFKNFTLLALQKPEIFSNSLADFRVFLEAVVSVQSTGLVMRSKRSLKVLGSP